METKFVVIVALSVLCIQGFDARTVESNPKTELLEKVAQDTITHLSKTIDLISQFYQTDVIYHSFHIKRDVLQELGRIEKAVLNEIARIEKYVKKTIQDAISAGMDISRCGQTAFKEVLGIPKYVKDELTHCVTEPVRDLEEIVQESIDIITNAVDTVAHIQQDLNKCLKTWNPIKCVNEVIDNAKGALLGIPSELKSNLKEVKEVIWKLRITMMRCMTGTFDSVISKTIGIEKEFIKCTIESIS